MAALAAVVAWCATTGASAQTLTRGHEEIEQQIEMAIDCFRNPNFPGCFPECDRNDPNDPDCPHDSPPDCSLYWRSDDHVTVSRASASSLDVVIRLACDINNFTDPDVTIRLQLALSCNGLAPKIRAAPTDARVDVDFPWYIDVLSASVTWWIGNIKSRTQTAQLRAGGALERFVSNTDVPFEYCPGIAVQSNGDVVIDLAMGTECTSGQTRHRGCLSGTHGPGADDVCIGGRWTVAAFDCEPTPPPGGQPL
jgi:hypothetical protein